MVFREFFRTTSIGFLLFIFSEALQRSCDNMHSKYLLLGDTVALGTPETKDDAFAVASNFPSYKFPCIILVNPYLDANVGSVSRAMLNFGLTELRVVDPNCDILSENSIALSCGSSDILRHAKIYPTLAAATSDLQRIFATTVRQRHMTQMIFTPEAAAEVLVTATGSENLNCGIVFGRERRYCTYHASKCAEM